MRALSSQTRAFGMHAMWPCTCAGKQWKDALKARDAARSEAHAGKLAKKRYQAEREQRLTEALDTFRKERWPRPPKQRPCG